MDLRDIPSIEQTVAAISSLYSSYISPYCGALRLAPPAIPCRKYTILLLGDQNSGKSSFVNHCVGRNLLRSGHGRTTERLTFVLPGAARQTLTLAQAREHFPEIAGFLLRDGADAVVEIYAGMRSFEASESAYLSQISSVFEPQKTVAASPFFFIDTPGITGASGFGLMKELAKKVDQVLFFANSGGFELSPQTCDFLQFLAHEKLFRKVKIVISKIDQLETKFEAVEAIANCVQLIHRVVPFTDFQVFPVSLPKFLEAKTKVQRALNDASPAYERSKLQQSLTLCDSVATDQTVSEVNSEPFLVAQFDLLAELENQLVDELIRQFNGLLDRYAADVRNLGAQLKKHEGEALNQKRHNATLLWSGLLLGGCLFSLVFNMFKKAVKIPYDRELAAALFCGLLGLTLCKKRAGIPLQQLTEMQDVVENHLLKTVKEIEKAK